VGILYFKIHLISIINKKKINFQIGLKPWEAMTKLKKIENENMIKSIKPLKEVFASETLEKLEAGEEFPIETTEIK
jgi:hypothetical protein